MKTFIVFFFGLFINVILLAQNNNPHLNRKDWYEPQPVGFAFIPQGSFQDTSFINKDTIIQTITSAPFWMSNEITNKEFRDFITYLKMNPEDSLCIVDWNKAKQENIDETKIDKAKYRKCLKNKLIEKNIIDTMVMKYDKPELKNYFLNKEYNDYPVVGVSYKGATFFCLWKTKIEREKNGPEYKMNDYRIPTAEEWRYTASKVPSEKKSTNTGLKKVNSGIKNELKLNNFSGNVSEWTSSTPDSISVDKRVVMGGSWKTESNLYERNIVDKKTQSSNIGFRLVRSYIGTKNQ